MYTVDIIYYPHTSELQKIQATETFQRVIELCFLSFFYLYPAFLLILGPNIVAWSQPSILM